MLKHQPTDDGVITAIVGSSGSGKTAWLKQQIATSSRLLGWGIEGQYTEKTKAVYTKEQLVKAIQELHVRISYQPKQLADFDYWARCAFAFVRLGAENGLMTDIVAEELADVTSPAKAPEGWGMLVRRGRKYGANIYRIKHCLVMLMLSTVVVCNVPTTAYIWRGSWTCRYQKFKY